MKLDFQTDDGIGTRANIGLIVLAADETIEHEFRQIMTGEGIALYVSRIPMTPEVNPNTLAQMETDIPAAARLLPDIAFDAIGYACTSAATVIGSAQVASAVQTAHPTAQVTDPMAAIIAATNALGARRIGFVTPYVAAVSAQMRERLTASGFEIVGFGSFEEGDDRVVARITPASIRAAISAVAAQAPCDAIVVACTNLRCLGVIAAAEAEIGVPVITSNQALAWDLLGLSGVKAHCTEFGQIFGE